MTGIDHRAVGKFVQRRKAVVHLTGIAARQVGSAAPVQEQCVARDQAAVHQEALRPGSVTGSVNEGHLDIAENDGVSALVGHEM